MKLTKAVSILVFVLSALAVRATASDTLVVIFDRQQFVQGDTLNIEVYSENYAQHTADKGNQPAQTLHLWIDEKKTGRRWKYRYPFLKGRQKIALRISDSIPNGEYAFNFLLQNQFLAIKGKIANATKQDTSINFVAKGKNKVPIIDGTDVQATGNFKIDQLYYADSVLFSFSRPIHKKENPLKLVIETPLDSAFIPQAMTTEFIIVGITDKSINPATAAAAYVFDINDPGESKLLKEITLNTKAKKQLDEYISKNVSNLFGYDDAQTLDLLNSDEASSFPDLMSYLVYKFPGLVQKINSENGQPYLTLRNETVDIYIDEFMDDISRVSIQDVAMVRFFRQSLRLSSGMNNEGFGGSIAIYTKTPEDKKGNKLSNYTFFIKGYSPKYIEWK